MGLSLPRIFQASRQQAFDIGDGCIFFLVVYFLVHFCACYAIVRSMVFRELLLFSGYSLISSIGHLRTQRDTMKYTTLFFLSIVVVSGFPGMDILLNDIRSRQSTTGTSEMIGDLIDGATTAVGRQVRECITGAGSCENQDQKVRPLLILLCVYSI